MSRDDILGRIRDIQLDNVELDKYEFSTPESDAMVDHFCRALEKNHVKVVKVRSETEVSRSLAEEESHYERVLRHGETLNFPVDQLQVYSVNSQLGVAENGAMWIASDSEARILPFIVEKLVVQIAEDSLVPTMHEAYKSVRPSGGFGVFIAGPSKTADIEQSLVIGAHGAREMTVILKTN